jgi:hypothetical protein
MTKHTTFGHTDQFGRSLTVRVLSHYWQWVLLTIWCSSRIRGGSVSIGPRDHLFRATTVKILFIVIVFICISRLSTRLACPQRYRVLAIGDCPRPRGHRSSSCSYYSTGGSGSTWGHDFSDDRNFSARQHRDLPARSARLSALNATEWTRNAPVQAAFSAYGGSHFVLSVLPRSGHEDGRV